MKLSRYEELKKLKKLESKYIAELKALNLDKENLCIEIDIKTKALNDIKNKIKKVEDNSNIMISDHAILRYLERVMGIDIEMIKKEILPEKSKQTIQTLGNGTYPINNKYKIVVKNNTIVTITELHKGE